MDFQEVVILLTIGILHQMELVQLMLQEPHILQLQMIFYMLNGQQIQLEQ